MFTYKVAFSLLMSVTELKNNSVMSINDKTKHFSDANMAYSSQYEFSKHDYQSCYLQHRRIGLRFMASKALQFVSLYQTITNDKW